MTGESLERDFVEHRGDANLQVMPCQSLSSANDHWYWSQGSSFPTWLKLGQRFVVLIRDGWGGQASGLRTRVHS